MLDWASEFFTPDLIKGLLIGFLTTLIILYLMIIIPNLKFIKEQRSMNNNYYDKVLKQFYDESQKVK
jgi:hypothetical protein